VLRSKDARMAEVTAEDFRELFPLTFQSVSKISSPL
jgi:hypothetical protein